MSSRTDDTDRADTVDGQTKTESSLGALMHIEIDTAPPPGLVDDVVAEIPSTITGPAEIVGPRVRRAAARRTLRALALAATLIVAAGLAQLAWRGGGPTAPIPAVDDPRGFDGDLPVSPSLPPGGDLQTVSPAVPPPVPPASPASRGAPPSPPPGPVASEAIESLEILEEPLAPSAEPPPEVPSPAPAVAGPSAPTFVAGAVAAPKVVHVGPGEAAELELQLTAASGLRDPISVDSTAADAILPDPALAASNGFLVDLRRVDARSAGSGVANASTAPHFHFDAARRQRMFRLYIEPLEPFRRKPNSGPADLDRIFTERLDAHPFVETEDDPQSTFGLDVDTASYALVRSHLRGGALPPEGLVRVEEMVNAVGAGIPAPAPEDGDFAIRIDGGPTPYAGDPEAPGRHRLVRIGLRARDVSAAERRPSRLTFVVDTSGSMGEGDRLELVKAALRLLLDQLGSEDRVGLVEYSDSARVVVEPTSDFAEVRGALRDLRAHGGTHAAAGLVKGYTVARGQALEGGNNRVIFLSDGVANIGMEEPGSLLELLRLAGEGIELLAVGVGLGNYNDVLLEKVANGADGRYAYIDSVAEAERLFVRELGAVMQTVAEEAKVQVSWDPAAVERYRLLGYQRRDLPDHAFRDDAADAGEIGAGHTVTALYEVELAGGWRAPRRLGTVHLRYRGAGGAEGSEAEPIEIETPIERRHLVDRWAEATPSFRFAASVAEFAEILGGSRWAESGTLDAVADELRTLRGDAPHDPLLVEVLGMVEDARELSESGGAAGE